MNNPEPIAVPERLADSERLLTWSENLAMRVEFMDETHREFIDLVNMISHCVDRPQLILLYQQLIEHTQQHFQREEQVMQETQFSAIGEHQADHRRVLNELTGFQRSLHRGRTQLVKSFLNDRLPEWFKLHLATMDAALAAHIKSADQSG